MLVESKKISTENAVICMLKNLRNESRAVWDKLYHKSQREHWGVSAPERNQIARALSKEHSAGEILLLARSLWDTDLFDPMILAAKLLALPKIKPTPALWEMIVGFLQKVDGWALEDTLAHAAWKCVLNDESLLDVLEGWTNHPNFWMRRAALIYTLPFAKPNRNPERPLKWASLYAKDSEWFIQKSIGWWLRVLGEHNPKRVALFLKNHWDQLKSVARKEATRKLSLEWRSYV
ncbi:MAG: DNA alkylation repair protein [Parachlamydiales bacterium]|nr:DNA alkylation repair protein [Parachlamydiales bacterium]